MPTPTFGDSPGEVVEGDKKMVFAIIEPMWFLFQVKDPLLIRIRDYKLVQWA